MLNLEWTTPEQNFLHQRVLMDAKKLDKEQLLEIFEIVHKQYLIRGHLFACLSKWCAQNGVTLPAFSELLEPKKVDHPAEYNQNPAFPRTSTDSELS